MGVIREHDIVLEGNMPDGKTIKLRPMTDRDFDILLKWNSDPEVLYYADGDDVDSYSLDDIKVIYGMVSQEAFCFITEYDGRPIGECWLQKMNIKEIKEKYKDNDCRRIDLVIGDKSLWGGGIGTKVIGMLTEFGFLGENADMIFGLVADYNLRSAKAFQKNGYVLVEKFKLEHFIKSNYELRFAVDKKRYLNSMRR